MKRYLFPFIALNLVSAASTAQFPAYRSAIGFRAGYADLGGDQFSTLSNGLTFEGFLRAPVNDYFSLELGVGAGAHRLYLLCLSFRPCQESEESVVTGLFVTPQLRREIPGMALVAYGGIQTGLLFGAFQGRGAGIELGLVLGSALPLYRNLSADVSVVASMVHVGTEFPQSALGRRFVLRIGGAYALHDATADGRPPNKPVHPRSRSF